MTKLTLLCACLAACTTTATESDSTGLPDGLTLGDRAPDHVSGTFVKNGVAVQIDLETSPRRITISDADGSPLIDSVLGEDGVETISILDGRETISGRRGETQPTIDGDATAQDDLTQLPEAELIPAALEALGKTDVPENMYRGGVDLAARYQGFTLYCGQIAYLPTYSIWWSSLFVRYDQSSTTWGRIHVQDLWSIWDENLQPGAYHATFGPRWSFALKVTNTCAFGYAPVYVASDAY